MGQYENSRNIRPNLAVQLPSGKKILLTTTLFLLRRKTLPQQGRGRLQLAVRCRSLQSLGRHKDTSRYR